MNLTAWIVTADVVFIGAVVVLFARNLRGWRRSP